MLFSIPVGEMTSPIFIMVIPLIALAPVCIVVGVLYTLGCKLLALIPHENDSSVPGRVFLFEAIGSGVAGFIASVILFRYFDNFQIAILICGVNLFVAFFFVTRLVSKRTYLFIALFVASALILMISLSQLDRFSSKKRWGYLNLAHTETSIYGNIAVTKMEETYSFYENGMLMYTHPDLMAAEESVHFALLEHPNPRSVLLIGGDAAGSLPQVLYHPGISSVDLVLLDPKSIEIAKRFLPGLTEILNDERIAVVYQDGRLFLKQTKKRYDVIIVNLPDPQTALINRFYTLEFFQSAGQKLTEQGLLGFSLTSSENVLSDEQAVLLSCLYRTMKCVFPEIVLIPGNSIHYIGGRTPGQLTDDPDILIQRLQQRHLPTIYFREYYIPFRMTPERMSYVREKLAQSQAKIINRDFHPIGYFYDIILWLTYFHYDLQSVVHFVDQIDFRLVLIGFAGAIFILWLIFLSTRRERKRIRPGVIIAIMMVGFSTISIEVLIILGFQAIYGYAYYQLALIMSGFMIGLMAGSWHSLRSISSHKSHFSRFVTAQIFLTIYSLFVYAVLTGLAKLILPAIIIQVVFLILIIGIGFIGGYQFPLANQLVFQRGEQIEAIGGRLYAADLFGSVIGAMVTSTVLIPIFGFGYACIIFCLLNFGVLILLAAL